MKVIVFNGSPKKEKSDTMHITRAFLEGMNEIEAQEVHIVDIIDKHIEFCSGCLSCMRNGGVCHHNDDMRGILEEIPQNDLLLFSFPLYCYGMPAMLKNMVDRILPLTAITMKKDGERYVHEGQCETSHLKFMMICGCGFPNSRKNFEPAVEQFKLLFPNNHTILTIPESPMFNAPEANVVTKPRLELVKEAGRQYAAQGKIQDDLKIQIGTPMIPEETYAQIVNGG